MRLSPAMVHPDACLCRVIEWGRPRPKAFGRLTGPTGAAGGPYQYRHASESRAWTVAVTPRARMLSGRTVTRGSSQ